MRSMGCKCRWSGEVRPHCEGNTCAKTWLKFPSVISATLASIWVNMPQ